MGTGFSGNATGGVRDRAVAVRLQGRTQVGARSNRWAQPSRTRPSATCQRRVVATASSIRRSWVTSSSVPG
ncbi:hypothetical protein GCM10023225_24630 [Kineococcus glutinatus]|uniref:Uncharacterized protein n=1 Tax=Kineococcus glutinatus TaxID=1070872 RepID=A0ABP9I1X3_9ACTN